MHYARLSSCSAIVLLYKTTVLFSISVPEHYVTIMSSVVIKSELDQSLCILSRLKVFDVNHRLCCNQLVGEKKAHIYDKHTHTHST